MEKKRMVICIMPEQAARIVRAGEGVQVTVDQFGLQGNPKYAELSIDPGNIDQLPESLQDVIRPIVHAAIALQAESLDK